MARVTIEDCIKDDITNRFDVILAASKRAHQLNKGFRPTVEAGKDKPTVIALREIADGYFDVQALLLTEEAQAPVLL